MIRFSCVPSPLGPVSIGWEDQTVVSIRVAPDPCSEYLSSPISELVALQLREYFEGTRKRFDFPICPKGTPFQLSVWSALIQIPYGQTRTYGQIASMIGRPKAARAVGMACNRNPIWIAIPCHRVVGTNHNLTGYAGGLPMKEALLNLEQSHT